MKINFRQGIIRYPHSGSIQQFLLLNGSVVDLLTNTPVEITLAHKGSDYLFVEPQSVPGAWTINGGVDQWLYWDINLRTGQRTFGVTEVAPVVNITAPGSPVEDMHWFDMDAATMFVYKNSMWREVVRVFAAKLDSAGNFIPVSLGLPTLPFGGTQAGLDGTERLAGRIIFDADGKPLIRDNGEFMTLESQFFVPGSHINAVRLESNTALAPAGENLPEFQVVKYTPTGQLQVAIYEDTGITALAMTLSSAVYGQPVDHIIQGIVRNPAWNWTTMGVPLWVDNGYLVAEDPHLTDNLSHPQHQVPVARVIAPDTIIFEQGLGGVGPKGPAGSVGTLPPATVIDDGAVRMTVPPLNPLIAIAVGDNDPRMSDSRVPVPHVHSSSEITVTPTGEVTSPNLQGAIGNLETLKISKNGGTMVGSLLLSGDPVASLEAATKQYVDGLVSGLVWKDPIHHVNLISDAFVDPSLIVPHTSDLYIVPTGAIGAWAGLDGRFVLWNGASWIDLGLVSTHPIGLRLGVAMETPTVPSGSFVSEANKIAILTNPYGPTFSFVTPSTNEAVFVNNAESLHAYHQYVFDGSKWVEFGGPQAFQNGVNLTLVGNILDVKQYVDGGTVDASTLRGSVPGDFAPTSHSHIIDDLTDVTVTAAVDNQMLTHSAGEWVNADFPYDVDLQYFGSYTASDNIVFYKSVRNFSIYATGHMAVADIPCTSPTLQFTIKKNGISIGTILFSSGNPTGSVNLSAAVPMVAGDVLSIQAPTVGDATLKTVAFNFKGKLV